MRGISPSPPNLGELTGLFPGVLTKVASTERNFALSTGDEFCREFSRVRHGFGVREAVPLAVGSLSYRRVICPLRRSGALRGCERLIYGVTFHAPIGSHWFHKFVIPITPLCEPLTDREESIPPCALRAFWALLCALRLCPDFGRTYERRG